MATSASDPTLPEPPGLLVPQIAALSPSKTILKGNYCTLTPLTLDHVPALYQSIGGIHDPELWAYIASGPFPDEKSFTQHMEFLLQDHPFYAFAILPVSISNTDTPAQPIGLICFLNIVPSNRSIEIGHVVYGKSLQRTTAATEAVYLMMKHCFEDLHYMRVEWKANNLNAPSKRAAERLGFVFEGVFRKHQVVKDRRRDTAWFSVCDDEWVGRSERTGDVKQALEAWLDGGNFDAEGRQRRKLEEFRKGGE